MPVMNGHEATHAIRARGIQTPIIAITANGTDSDKQACQDAGFTGYLTKPISIAALLRGVGNQLGVALERTPSPCASELASTANRPGVIATQQMPVNNQRSLTARTGLTLPTDPVFRDFATRFVQKVSDSLPDLDAAIELKDKTKLSDLGHWIKGTGGTVGLQGLTDIGVELQAAAKSSDFVAAQNLVTELKSIVTMLQLESQLDFTSPIPLNKC